MDNNSQIQIAGPATPPPGTISVIEAPPALRVGEHVFQPIVLGTRTVAGKKTSRILHFTQKEIRFLDKFLETHNLELACIEVGATEAIGRKWLRKKKFRDYFEEKTRIAALSNGTDINEHLAFLREVRDGIRTPTENAMEAAKQLSRFLKPTGPASVNVSVTQNNAAPMGAASPFKGQSIHDLAGAMKARVEIIEATVVKP